MSASATDRFSLVAGGPFHALLSRLGLLAEDGLPSTRAIIALPLMAWSLPTLLSVLQSLYDDTHAGWGIFTDPTVYARYLVAIWAMVATERYADHRVSLIARHFRSAKLLDEAALEQFHRALEWADRRSSAALPEYLILLLALGGSLASTEAVSMLARESWEASGEGSLSWAGWASALGSNLLFLFLVLRWLWRFTLWARLLAKIARLKLQLTPIHPDRAGGLGFLSLFPGIFSGYIFAVSSVVSFSFVKALQLSEFSDQVVWFAVAAWLGFVLLVFLAPLLVFVAPLYRTRERAMLSYGELAQRHHLSFHQRWIINPSADLELLGSADPSSVSDLNASVQTVMEMRALPIDRPAIVQLLVSAGLPMLAVALAQMPLLELLKLLTGLIL